MSLDYLIELDREVDAAEGEGLRARWQFGRALLAERVGKKLPIGLLDEVVGEIGKSRAEVQYRMLFARRFDTEVALLNAIEQYGSWYAIVNEALASTAHLSAEKDEWETPPEIFEVAHREFGFTVDACASAKNAKLDRYWTLDDDGLAQDWTGETVWMNPPYSEMETWIAKARDAGASGATAVCLVPSRTDVGWFWDHARHGHVRFLRGRLSFVDDLGNTGPAPFPSVLVVFGPDHPPSFGWQEP